MAVSLTDRMDRVVQYSYDDDRLAAATWLPAGGGAAVAYEYDDAGRLVRVRDGAGEYAQAYDAAGRPVSVDDQGTTGLPQVTLTYDYDVRGRLTWIVQSGTGVAAERDGRRRACPQRRPGTLNPGVAATSGRSGSARGGRRPSRS